MPDDPAVKVHEFQLKPDEDVVKAARQLLEQARKGYIRGFVSVASCADGAVATNAIGRFGNLLESAGACLAMAQTFTGWFNDNPTDEYLPDPDETPSDD